MIIWSIFLGAVSGILTNLFLLRLNSNIFATYFDMAVPGLIFGLIIFLFLIIKKYKQPKIGLKIVPFLLLCAAASFLAFWLANIFGPSFGSTPPMYRNEFGVLLSFASVGGFVGALFLWLAIRMISISPPRLFTFVFAGPFLSIVIVLLLSKFNVFNVFTDQFTVDHGVFSLLHPLWQIGMLLVLNFGSDRSKI